MSLVTFPDAAAAVREIVAAAFAERGETVEVFTRVPASNVVPGLSTFVVVRGVGGNQETPVSAAPLITVEGYAPKRAEAYRLCDLALGVIRAQDGTIRGARGFTFPQELPDPTTSQVRFTSTGEVRVWGAVIP